MLNNLQNPLALVGRILLALMFVLAGASKIGGFSGTVGYIASGGLPAPAVLAVLTIVLLSYRRPLPSTPRWDPRTMASEEAKVELGIW